MKIEKKSFLLPSSTFHRISHTQPHTQIPAHRNQLIFVDADCCLVVWCGCCSIWNSHVGFTYVLYRYFLYVSSYVFLLLFVLLHPTTLIQWHYECGGREGRKSSTSTSPLIHREKNNNNSCSVWQHFRWHINPATFLLSRHIPSVI